LKILLGLTLALHSSVLFAKRIAIPVVVVSSGTVKEVSIDSLYTAGKKSVLIKLEKKKKFRLLLDDATNITKGAFVSIYYLEGSTYRDKSAIACAITVRELPNIFLYFWERLKNLGKPIHILGKQENGCNLSPEKNNLDEIKTEVALEKSRQEAEAQSRIGSDANLFSAEALLLIERDLYFETLINACYKEFQDTGDALKKRIENWRAKHEQDVEKIIQLLDAHPKYDVKEMLQMGRSMSSHRIYFIPDAAKYQFSYTECTKTPVDPKGYYKNEIQKLTEELEQLKTKNTKL